MSDSQESRNDTTRTLRRAFMGNAFFSLLCASLFVLDAAPLAQWAGLSSPLPLTVVGVGLVGFAAWLIWLARRPTLTHKIGYQVSLMDAQWVLGTAILLIGWPELLNGSGQLAAVAIAIAVSGFAVWQWTGAQAIQSVTLPAEAEGGVART